MLAGLSSGSYTLTLTKGGYVDTNGDPSPLSLSSTVTGTGTATPSGGNPVLMAQAGTINASFTANSGALTGQEADVFSWLGTGSTDKMSNPDTYDPSTTPVTQLPSSGSENLMPPSRSPARATPTTTRCGRASACRWSRPRTSTCSLCYPAAARP